MERDIIVYEKITGELYKIKEVAGEAILCCPRENLSRLSLTRENSNFDVIKACKDGESEFVYLCDAGGCLSAQNLFYLLLYILQNHVCGSSEDNIKDAIEFLVANHVKILPWRNRFIDFNLIFNKENKWWGLVDTMDYGMMVSGYDNLKYLIEDMALVLKVIKDQTLVVNIQINCSTDQIYLFWADVLTYVKFRRDELKLIEN